MEAADDARRERLAPGLAREGRGGGARRGKHARLCRLVCEGRAGRRGGIHTRGEAARRASSADRPSPKGSPRKLPALSPALSPRLPAGRRSRALRTDSLFRRLQRPNAAPRDPNAAACTTRRWPDRAERRGLPSTTGEAHAPRARTFDSCSSCLYCQSEIFRSSKSMVRGTPDIFTCGGRMRGEVRNDGHGESLNGATAPGGAGPRRGRPACGSLIRLQRAAERAAWQRGRSQTCAVE